MRDLNDTLWVLFSKKGIYTLIILILLLPITLSCGNRKSYEELNQDYLQAFEDKNWNKAIATLNILIERSPDDANAYFARAMAKSNLKEKTRTASVLRDLNHLISLEPENQRALHMRFQAHLLENNFDKSIQDLDKLIELKGKLPYLLSWKGNVAFANQDFKQAIKYYEQRLTMPGTVEDLKNNYYYLIFSKYFSDDKEGAMWDTAFLPDRGFEKDSILLNNIINDELEWEPLTRFKIPEMTLEELDRTLNQTH